MISDPWDRRLIATIFKKYSKLDNAGCDGPSLDEAGTGAMQDCGGKMSIRLPKVCNNLRLSIPLLELNGLFAWTQGGTSSASKSMSWGSSLELLLPK
jgi:hypothetical protein